MDRPRTSFVGAQPTPPTSSISSASSMSSLSLLSSLSLSSNLQSSTHSLESSNISLQSSNLSLQSSTLSFDSVPIPTSPASVYNSSASPSPVSSPASFPSSRSPSPSPHSSFIRSDSFHSLSLSHGPSSSKSRSKAISTSTPDLTQLSSPAVEGNTAPIRKPRAYKKRRRLSAQETSLLMDSFEKNPKPNAKIRTRLAMMIPGMSERTIQIWFQNRRAKVKQIAKTDPTPSTFSSLKITQFNGPSSSSSSSSSAAAAATTAPTTTAATPSASAFSPFSPSPASPASPAHSSTIPSSPSHNSMQQRNSDYRQNLFHFFSPPSSKSNPFGHDPPSSPNMRTQLLRSSFENYPYPQDFQSLPNPFGTMPRSISAPTFPPPQHFSATENVGFALRRNPFNDMSSNVEPHSMTPVLPQQGSLEGEEKREVMSIKFLLHD